MHESCRKAHNETRRANLKDVGGKKRTGAGNAAEGRRTRYAATSAGTYSTLQRSHGATNEKSDSAEESAAAAAAAAPSPLAVAGVVDADELSEKGLSVRRYAWTGEGASMCHEK